MAMSRVTLRERFFPLHQPDDVDRFLERFQWGYLDRLAKEAVWRDDETFDLLNSLFENEWGRDVRAARLVAVEFQGQLAGRLEPLQARAARMLERLSGR
jgi:hypothetical protein